MRQPTVYEQLTFDQKKRLWEYLVSIGIPQQAPKKPKASKTKEARIPWPLGPKKLGAPKFRSRTYGITVGQSTAARISLAEFEQIKKRSQDMFKAEAI